MKVKLISISVSVIILLGASYVQAKSSFGNGIQFIPQDSSFSIKFSARFQTLFTAEKVLNESTSELETRLMIRRSRLKFDGFVYNPNLTYKIELGLTNRDQGSPIPQTGNAPGIIYDAVLKWKITRGLSVWFGQTKLPGNRERVISSQQLQFVDRSIVNAAFNIDRDLGFQLHHEFNVGNMIIKEIASISQGEGRNITTANEGGYDYTGRLEFLPLGKFKDKGDYFGSDLSREDSPKLSIAFGYDYNDKAARRQGQLGNFLPETRSLSTLMSDLMFKYRGFSFMAEYMDKTAERPIVTDVFGTKLGAFEVGKGIVAQAGYLLKSDWEFATRYAQVTPDKKLNDPQVSQYTFGISKYIVGHNLKVQTDFSLTDTEDVTNKEFTYRFQVEMAF